MENRRSALTTTVGRTTVVRCPGDDGDAAVPSVRPSVQSTGEASPSVGRSVGRTGRDGTVWAIVLDQQVNGLLGRRTPSKHRRDLSCCVARRRHIARARRGVARARHSASCAAAAAAHHRRRYLARPRSRHTIRYTHNFYWAHYLGP